MIRRLAAFGLHSGDVLAGKYEVLCELGVGWEGEVYKVRELGTRIERAAKLFYPQRNPKNRAVRFHAQKHHRLRDCPILIQYHTRETIDFDGREVSFLVSEFVEGELLSDFVYRQPRRRLHPFEALHLLYVLAEGLEQIHDCNEYHGDLHMQNVLVRRRGISFEAKLFDMFYHGPSSAEMIRTDVCDLVRIFYDALGGVKQYSKLPPEVKHICCGLKRSLIQARFRNAGNLRHYLDTMEWFSS